MGDEGESSAQSCSSQESEDNCEQPLKRARYARYTWEMKGSDSDSDSVKEEKKGVCKEDDSRNRKESSHSAYRRLNDARAITPNNYPVHKWQTRQVAKAVVDNTINKVIEDMGFVPLPLETQDLMDDMFPLDRRDEHVEDEAVLMAIQSHGLQQKDWTCPRSGFQSFENQSENLNQFDHFSLLESKNWSELKNNENSSVFIANRANASCINDSSKQESSNNNNSIVQSSLENKSPPNLEKDNLDKNMFEHDFLAQAVAVAIQKKGLSTYLADDGR